MVSYISFAFLLFGALIAVANARQFCRCDLASELYNIHGFKKEQLATWVCIAQYASDFNTAHQVGKQNGIFAILDGWCGVDSYSGNCNILCSDFRDDSISDDVVCARHMFRYFQKSSGNGFMGFDAYKVHCKNQTNIDNFLRGCFPTNPVNCDIAV